MSVFRGRGDIFVTEHLLHDFEIAGAKGSGRCRVAGIMESEVLNASAGPVAPPRRLEALYGDRVGARHEQALDACVWPAQRR